MMGTIEEAAKRLELLRRAGIVLPQTDVASLNAPTPAGPVPLPTAAAPAGDTSVEVKRSHAPEIDVADLANSHAAESHTATGLRSDVSQHGDVVTIHLPSFTADAEHLHPEAPDSAAFGQKQSRQVDADLAGMARHALLVPGGPRSQLEEEFRLIKRPLLENIRSPESIRPARANLIMVTSAVPGEGKTQSAINLAISIAMELDHRVLLVEADVLRPALLTRLGISARKGLMDVLAGEVEDLSEVLLRTNIPKLTVLPAGAMRSSATEMLASSSMAQLLDELANKYSDRVIVFDTPPLLSTTESLALASNMGQVVMVVEAYRTQVQLIKQAFAAVETHPVVMSMLNKYNGPRSGEGYGYYAP
jgi:protein-tyrosine kinase